MLTFMITSIYASDSLKISKSITNLKTRHTRVRKNFCSLKMAAVADQKYLEGVFNILKTFKTYVNIYLF